MTRAVYTLLILCIASSLAVAGEKTFSKAQICKAGIAIVMGKDPSIMRVDKTKGSTTYLSYVRQSDNKKYAYRCKLSGNRIIWASSTGRWRDSKYDSKVVYKIDGETIQIEDRFSDGSGTKKSFSLKQLN